NCAKNRQPFTIKRLIRTENNTRYLSIYAFVQRIFAVLFFGLRESISAGENRNSKGDLSLSRRVSHNSSQVYAVSTNLYLLYSSISTTHSSSSSSSLHIYS